MKKKIAGVIGFVLLFVASAYAVNKIRTGALQLGSGTVLTGTQGNSGIIQQAGTISGTGILCADSSGNTTTVSCNSISLYTRKPLSSPVSVTLNTLTAIDSFPQTMPASGGPFRAHLDFFYYNSGGVNIDCYVSDGTNTWAGSEWNVSNNRSSCVGAGFSPVTYANGANVTFTVYIYDTGNSTIEVSPTAGGGPSSAMAVTLFPSN